jgi:hypothetical protein
MEILDLLNADRVIAILALLIGILATKYYGSNYLPRRKGLATEKYMVTDIFPFRVKGNVYNLAQLQLVKSSIKNACGFAGLHVEPQRIVFHHYGFANNCLHAVIAPGHILYEEGTRNQQTSSNEFSSITVAHNPTSVPKEFIPKKYRKYAIEAMLVTLDYSFPKTYTGPLYKSKSLLFAKGIGLIKAVTTYQDGQRDEFTLKTHKVLEASDAWWPIQQIGNFWVYDIVYAHGPNKVNIKHG